MTEPKTTEQTPSTEQASILSRLAPRPPKPPKEVQSKAGRNLPAAVATALILLTIVGLSIAFRIEFFVLLVTIVVMGALWEAAGAFLARDIRLPLTPMMLGALMMIAHTWFIGVETGILTYLVASFAVVVWRSYIGGGSALRDGLAGVFVLGWIGVFGMFAVALASLPKAPFVIIAFILLPVANDTGGWLAGIFFGKHPIAASISPKKSWEGFVGSVLAALLISFLTVDLLLGLHWQWALGIALLTPVFATAGDFAESLLKRDLGVKDMGSIFPGHGGILDRVDSILFCAPMLYGLLGLGMGVF
ncbi:MAG: phosphatidate cytidylyltransferase [Actinomycetaceae bacterium]|nr:phosphatidate cytidylyltransferase [Actinomycetaceae bacterium]